MVKIETLLGGGLKADIGGLLLGTILGSLPRTVSPAFSGVLGYTAGRETPAEGKCGPRFSGAWPEKEAHRLGGICPSNRRFLCERWVKISQTLPRPTISLDSDLRSCMRSYRRGGSRHVQRKKWGRWGREGSP